MSSGLLDTSVVIDLDDAHVVERLPAEIAISAVTLAELTAGPALATSKTEQARRQARLQQVESTFDAIAFDAAVARSFGQIVAAITEGGRTHRSRVADLQISATAHANSLHLYTRNPDDFRGLENLVTIVAV